jgi:DNA-binding MarR family transcriptional regulator
MLLEFPHGAIEEPHAMTAAQPASDFDYTIGVRLMARLTRVAEQACQLTGISLPQYRLLAAVTDGPQRASALAARVGVSRPTLTSLVDGLEQAGLLRRVPVPTDRRGVDLAATPEGLAAVARADGALAERMFSLVPPERTASAVELVAQMTFALDREAKAR